MFEELDLKIGEVGGNRPATSVTVASCRTICVCPTLSCHPSTGCPVH